MPRLVVSQFGDTTPRFRSKVEPVVSIASAAIERPSIFAALIASLAANMSACR